MALHTCKKGKNAHFPCIVRKTEGFPVPMRCFPQLRDASRSKEDAFHRNVIRRICLSMFIFTDQKGLPQFHHHTAAALIDFHKSQRHGLP